MVPPFEMSMDARMVLAKMSLIFEREQGQRVKLSQDNDVVGLINYAWETLNHEYLRYFERFCQLLTPGEAEALREKGARIYRGAQVRGTEEPDAGSLKGKVTYRGQVIGGGAETAMAAETAPETMREPMPSEPAAPRPKKMYRGRVIED